MMKTRRQSRPEPELLEERALLSAVAHTHHVHPARVVPAPAAHLVTNTPPFLEAFPSTLPRVRPEWSDGTSPSPAVAALRRSARFSSRESSISASREPSASPTGTLILSDSQGTIRLSLKGNGGPLPLTLRPVSADSMQMRYTIVSGTGAYRSLHGSGSLALSLGPDIPPTVPPTSPPSPITGGPGSSTRAGVQDRRVEAVRVQASVPAPRPCLPAPCRRSPSRGEGQGEEATSFDFAAGPRPGASGTTGTGSPGQHGNGIRAVKAFALNKVLVHAR